MVRSAIQGKRRSGDLLPEQMGEAAQEVRRRLLVLGLAILSAVDGKGSCDLELIGVGAGGVELPQQGERLVAECLLDPGKLVEAAAAKGPVEPFCLGVDAPPATGAFEQGPQLAAGELGGRRRCRGSAQEGAGLACE
ncbi:hypothetical protein IPZ68_23065 [Streptomyces arenae]|nr:hypothetical protein [Streptomyces arenae]